MKIALLSDTHWGARGDSAAFSRYFSRFYREVFFPELKRRGITRIFHLGDLVDRRKYINFKTLRDVRETFVDECLRCGYSLDLIVGNHDTHYKNTNELNAVRELFGAYPIAIHSSPTEVDLDGLKVALVPWVCAENVVETYELLEKTDAQVVFGHLELAGFEMYRGVSRPEGVDPSLYSRFDLVLSGHYHHKSSRGGIHYLGAPYELTWSDYNDARGFHVLDTETRELEYVQNPLRIHRKLFYDDKGKRLAELEPVPSDLQDCVVRVVTKSRTNPIWFENYTDAILAQDPQSLSVVEDNHGADMVSDRELAEDVEDTPTMIHSYLAAMRMDEDVRPLTESIIAGLYEEALNIAARE